MTMPTAGSRLLEFAQESGQYHLGLAELVDAYEPLRALAGDA